MSQQELAEEIGVSRETISSVERGRSIPSVMLAIALAEALESSVEELFRAPETTVLITGEEPR